MTTLSKTELTNLLSSVRGDLVTQGNKIGFCPYNSSVYYWFVEMPNGLMNKDYYWSQTTGKRGNSFTMFANFLRKLNINY